MQPCPVGVAGLSGELEPFWEFHSDSDSAEVILVVGFGALLGVFLLWRFVSLFGIECLCESWFQFSVLAACSRPKENSLSKEFDKRFGLIVVISILIM